MHACVSVCTFTFVALCRACVSACLFVCIVRACVCDVCGCMLHAYLCVVVNAEIKLSMFLTRFCGYINKLFTDLW